MATGLSGIAHRRFDALRGSWVLIASPHKNKRPRQYVLFQTLGLRIFLRDH